MDDGLDGKLPERQLFSDGITDGFQQDVPFFRLRQYVSAYRFSMMDAFLLTMLDRPCAAATGCGRIAAQHDDSAPLQKLLPNFLISNCSRAARAFTAASMLIYSAEDKSYIAKLLWLIRERIASIRGVSSCSRTAIEVSWAVLEYVQLSDTELISRQEGSGRQSFLNQGRASKRSRNSSVSTAVSMAESPPDSHVDSQVAVTNATETQPTANDNIIYNRPLFYISPPFSPETKTLFVVINLSLKEILEQRSWSDEQELCMPYEEFLATHSSLIEITSEELNHYFGRYGMVKAEILHVPSFSNAPAAGEASGTTTTQPVDGSPGVNPCASAQTLPVRVPTHLIFALVSLDSNANVYRAIVELSAAAEQQKQFIVFVAPHHQSTAERSMNEYTIADYLKVALPLTSTISGGTHVSTNWDLALGTSIACDSSTENAAVCSETAGHNRFAHVAALLRAAHPVLQKQDTVINYYYWHLYYQICVRELFGSSLYSQQAAAKPESHSSPRSWGAPSASQRKERAVTPKPSNSELYMRPPAIRGSVDTPSAGSGLAVLPPTNYAYNLQAPAEVAELENSIFGPWAPQIGVLDNTNRNMTSWGGMRMLSYQTGMFFSPGIVAQGVLGPFLDTPVLGTFSTENTSSQGILDSALPGSHWVNPDASGQDRREIEDDDSQFVPHIVVDGLPFYLAVEQVRFLINSFLPVVAVETHRAPQRDAALGTGSRPARRVVIRSWVGPRPAENSGEGFGVESDGATAVGGAQVESPRSGTEQAVRIQEFQIVVQEFKMSINDYNGSFTGAVLVKLGLAEDANEMGVVSPTSRRGMSAVKEQSKDAALTRLALARIRCNRTLYYSTMAAVRNHLIYNRKANHFAPEKDGEDALFHTGLDRGDDEDIAGVNIAWEAAVAFIRGINYVSAEAQPNAENSKDLNGEEQSEVQSWFSPKEILKKYHVKAGLLTVRELSAGSAFSARQADGSEIRANKGIFKGGSDDAQDIFTSQLSYELITGEEKESFNETDITNNAGLCKIVTSTDADRAWK